MKFLMILKLLFKIFVKGVKVLVVYDVVEMIVLVLFKMLLFML